MKPIVMKVGVGVFVIVSALHCIHAHAATVGGGKHGNHGQAGFGPAGGQAAAGQAAKSGGANSSASSGGAGQSGGNGSVVLGYCDVAHYSICYKE